MNKKNFENAVLSQRVQLNQAQIASVHMCEEVDTLRQKQTQNKDDLASLEAKMDQLLEMTGTNSSEKELADAEDFEVLSQTDKEAIYEYTHNRFPILRDVPNTDFDSYVKSAEQFLASEGFNLDDDPMLQLFTTDELDNFTKQYNDKLGKLTWNKPDYIVIGITAVLAILIDIFLVALPEDMNFMGKQYKGSPITKKLKELTVSWYDDNSAKSKFGQWIHKQLKSLEDFAKVSYDVPVRNPDKGIDIDGLCPNYHRVMSMGHDPILAFIVGVIDILRGTVTAIDKNGAIHVVKVCAGGDGAFCLFEALLKVFCHLLSDICTTKGLPVPLMTLLECITGKSPFVLGKSGEKVSYTNLVRFLYQHGYDMRHMLTMGIEPFFIEFCIRTYYNLYYFDSLIDLDKDYRHKMKKTSMLTLTHTVAMSGDVLKMWINGWNPAAFNYTEFLSLVITVIRALKQQGKYSKIVDNEMCRRWENIISES